MGADFKSAEKLQEKLLKQLAIVSRNKEKEMK
jgi:hypothetical protein